MAEERSQKFADELRILFQGFALDPRRDSLGLGSRSLADIFKGGMSTNHRANAEKIWDAATILFRTICNQKRLGTRTAVQMKFPALFEILGNPAEQKAASDTRSDLEEDSAKKAAFLAKAKQQYRDSETNKNIKEAGSSSKPKRQKGAETKMPSPRGEASAPGLDQVMPGFVGPWITDEAVLAQYRRVYYGYYYTRRDQKYFWMHHRIDFSKYYPGCLHTINDYGIDEPIHYKVYAYIVQEMLVAVTFSEEEPKQLPSVAIYHDFCRRTRTGSGYFSFRVNEDWDTYFAAGASMMFRDALPNTKNEGVQDAKMCEELTERWKQMGGERCNRLFSLFDYGPYSASAETGTADAKDRRDAKASSAKRKKK